MWAIAGIIAVSGIILLLEIPSLVKKKLWKELMVFSVLLLMGTGLSVAQSLRLPIPNPLDWISYVFKPLNDTVFSFLKQTPEG